MTLNYSKLAYSAELDAMESPDTSTLWEMWNALVRDLYTRFSFNCFSKTSKSRATDYAYDRPGEALWQLLPYIFNSGIRLLKCL